MSQDQANADREIAELKGEMEALKKELHDLIARLATRQPYRDPRIAWPPKSAPGREGPFGGQ